MNYNNLTPQEKALMSRVLNTRHALEQTEKEHRQALAQVMDLARKNGTLVKGKEKVVYTPQGEYITLDTVKLKKDKPELMAEYGKTVSRKESVKCLIH